MTDFEVKEGKDLIYVNVIAQTLVQSSARETDTDVQYLASLLCHKENGGYTKSGYGRAGELQS